MPSNTVLILDGNTWDYLTVNKCAVSFKNDLITNYSFANYIYICGGGMGEYRLDLVLNNQQGLLCLKMQPTNRLN